MAFNVYHNPTDVSIGATALAGVIAVLCQTEFSEIHAAADDDDVESVARAGTGRTSGAIRFVDPVQASAAAGLAGTLHFTWSAVNGAADRTVTILNCRTGPCRTRVQRDAASTAEVPFIAASTDGNNSPLTIA